MKALALVLLLAGCASAFQPNYGDMTSAQIAAAGKDKSAAVICTRLIAPGYTLESVTVMLDQNAIKDGGVTGDGSKGCVASINSVAPPRAPPPAVPAKPTP